MKCRFRFCRSSKDTGLVLDFGNSNPFDYQGAMMGGAGTVYGMCGEDVAQLIISDKYGLG